MRRLKLIRDETKIDFLGRRRVALTGSAAAIVVAFLALVGIGLNFGIDFEGGSTIQARFSGPAETAEVREALEDLGLGEIKVQRFGVETDVKIDIESQADGDAQRAAEVLVAETLIAAFDGVEIRETASISPTVSGELIVAGVTAVILAILGVLAYIWLRFEWQFAVGAVAALVHDVAITIGLLSLLGVEFTLAIIAALLTIVGYSLNDTVVVYDRIRENLRRYKTTPLEEVLNLSVNETLSRTLVTSVTTLLALLALFLLGPATISGFTFTMILGVLIGTYSSIFIAAPALLALGVTRTSDDEQPGGASGGGAGVQFG